jgi:hypothetical protein
VGKDLYNLDDC